MRKPNQKKPVGKKSKEFGNSELSQKEKKFAESIDPETKQESYSWEEYDPREKPLNKFNIRLNNHYLEKLKFVSSKEDSTAIGLSSLLVKKGIEKLYKKHVKND